MAKFSFIKNNFQAGQLSPKLKGRTDIQEYPNGAELLKNMLPMPEGGASKRAGSLYLADIESDIDAIQGSGNWGYQNSGFRLIPFVDTAETSYTVAIGDWDLYSLFKDYDGNTNPRMPIPLALYDGDGNIVSGSSGYIYRQGLSPLIDDWFLNVLASQKGTTISKEGWSFKQDDDELYMTHDSNLVPPIVWAKPNSTFYTTLTNAPFPVIYNTRLTTIEGVEYRAGNQLPFLFPNIDSSSTVTAVTGSNPTIVANSRLFNIGQAGTYLRVVDTGGVEGVFFIKASSFALTMGTANYNVVSDRIDFTGHNISLDDPIRFVPLASPNAIPADLDEDTTYYAINVNANDFQISETVGGPAVTLSDNGLGTSYLLKLEVDRVQTTSIVQNTTGGATSDWTFSAWDYNSQGWPAVCGGYQQRNIMGSTARNKGSLWFSRVGYPVHFRQTKLNQDVGATDDVSGLNYFGDNVQDTDAFNRTLTEDVDSSISWMRSKRNLHVGTLFAEYIIGGSDGIFGPSNVFSSKQTDYGAKREQASGYGNASLFLVRDGKSLRDFRYSENNGSNISRNLSVLSDQILYSGFASGNYHNTSFKSLAWNNSRSTLFLLTTLGKLITITLEDSANVVAWAEHDLGADAIHGVSIIPNSDESYDDVYLCVERTIDGNTVQYLEKIQRTFEHPVLNNTSTSNEDKCVFLDSALILDLGASGTAVSGLDHLEGEIVRVVGDGANLGTYTVSSGAITLTSSARYLIIGLDFESEIKTMPIEAGAVTGSSQSYLKRIDQVHVKLFRSLGGKFGFGENLYDIEYPDHTEDTFTGHIRLDYDSTNDYEYAVSFKHTDPFPFNLLSVNMRGNTEE